MSSQLNSAGYRKDQLRVQLAKSGNLTISGEQPVGDNIWRRFRKTIPISENCDVSKISAKFEDFILYIAQPKLIIAEEKKDEKTTGTEAPEPQKPEESGEKPTSTTYPAEQTNETSNNSAEKAGVVPDNAQEKEKEQETGDGKSNESNDSKNVQEKAPETENTNAKSVSENNLTDEKTNGTAEDGKIKGSTNQKQESDLSNFATEMVGGATRLKMPRKMMNLVLAIILAVALALYVKKSVSSWNIAKN